MAKPKPGADPRFIQTQINQAIESGASQVVIPSGRYYTAPIDQVHLLIRDAHDLEIVADGVEMVCTETTQAIQIDNCSNLSLRGLAIDYDPLPFTEGRITSMSPDKQIHEIELFGGYPSEGRIRGFKYEIFDPNTHVLRYGSYYDPTVERIGPKKLRVTKMAYFANMQVKPEQVGDIVAVDSDYSPNGVKPHGVVISRSRNVELKDVTLYSSNCFGFFESECSGTKYIRCRVDRRPAIDDFLEREYPRVRSLNADAFHSKYAEIGPQYIDCFAHFQGDDCIAINGDYHLMTEAHDRTLRVIGKHTMNICAGDLLEMVSSEGVRLPDAQVTAVRPLGEATEEERQYLSAQVMYPPIKSGDKQVYEICIDGPVELDRGSIVAAANRMGNGYLIEGCRLGCNRSRGLAVKASKGRVVGNHFIDTRMPAILMNPDWYWLEAGSACDIEISGNTFEKCSMKSISICGVGDADGIGTRGAPGLHRDIRILGNEFVDCSEETVVVTATEGLSIDNNRFVRCAGPHIRISSSRNVGMGANTLVRDDGSTEPIELIDD